MKFGLNENQYFWIKENIVGPINDKGGKVFCYGSRARGDYRPLSDLDLMVESQNDEKIELDLFQELLENSDLPFKVDLVDFREFAESYKIGYQRDKTPF
jgi:predicted nucleotidyltransferase